MCGIFGIYNIAGRIEFKEDKIRRAIDKMAYRGPDASGVKIFEEKAAMAHLRLSIIDLNAESTQPFQIDDRYWISFNGEIFNYIEIRGELQALGNSFRTESDTEVLLRSYQVWGEDCVKHFNGMWAFTIYDKEKNALFCSRDRFGIKPFNYSKVNGQFIFSSTIKSIITYFPELRVPNYNVIANYCRNSIGAQTKETWFKNIFRLEPAHNMTVDRSGIKVFRYWDYPRKVNRQISFPMAVEKYKQLLYDSASLRMRSDVPVGFTLSSGLDSTSLVCLLKDKFHGNKNTYTAAFSGTKFRESENKNFKNNVEVNEPDIVKELTKELNLQPNIIEIRYDKYVNDLKKIIYHMESGHGSPAVFPLYQILKIATKEVTVVLEGQGTDEVLGGYISTVFPVRIIELLKRFEFGKIKKEIKAFSKTYSLKTSFMLFIRQSNFAFAKRLYYSFSNIEKFYVGNIKDYTQIKDYPREPTGFDNLLNKHLYKAHTGGLVNLLHYGDAVSMAHSMESRLPFMDYRLVEFIFTLPSDFKVHEGMGKYLHRIAMKGIVPEYILNNPVKFGFDSPLAHIFANNDEGSAKSILLSDRCLNRQLFSKQALEKAFEDQKKSGNDQSRILYRMLSVELWFREFIDKTD
jgi:asparagine synthase (glutamine-hydrolysing)